MSLDADERPSNKQQAQKLEEDQIEQTQRHSTRSCPDGREPRSSTSEAQPTFGIPQAPCARLSWLLAKSTPRREVFGICVHILILFRSPQRYGNNTGFDEIKSRKEILALCQVTESQGRDWYLV